MNYAKLRTHEMVFKNHIFNRFCLSCGGKPAELTDALYARYRVEDEGYAEDLDYHTVLNYFQHKVIPHKINVYQAGIDLLWMPWFAELKIDQDEWVANLLEHDLSKFAADEALGYAFYDFAKKDDQSPLTKQRFEAAWHLHKMRNPHHPEYWLNPDRGGVLSPQVMPVIYLAEMVADWIGAGKTYGATLKDWLPANLPRFHFHPDTDEPLRFILEHLGFHVEYVLGRLSIVQPALEPTKPAKPAKP